MNTAHNGQRLGQALYKICNHLRIVHKVTHHSDYTAFLDLWVVGWPHNLWQCIKKWHDDVQICPLLQNKNGAGVWCQKMTHLASLHFLEINFLMSCLHHRCLAHIINLATQALISTWSKAKYYNPHNVDEHTPDVSASEWEKLIHAICVKVRFE